MRNLASVPLLLLPLLLSLLILNPQALHAAERPCVSPDHALEHLNKDICIAAHVYNVVELSDGTRFLDVCSAETTDEQCRFSIISRPEDRREVGELASLRDQNIHIRGTVRPFAGRSELVLSHARQLHGGAEKFRPNPALLPGFSAERGKTSFNDKALSSVQHMGAFDTHGH